VNEDKKNIDLMYGHNIVEMNSQLFRVVNTFSVLSNCSSYLDSTDHQIFNIVNKVSINVISEDDEQLDYLPQILMTVNASSFNLEFSQKSKKEFQALSKGKTVLLRSITENNIKTLYYQTNYTMRIKKRTKSNIALSTDFNEKSISFSGLSKFSVDFLREGKLDADLKIDKKKRRNGKIIHSYRIYKFSITSNGELSFKDNSKLEQSTRKFYHALKLKIKPKSPWQLFGDTPSTYNLSY
jgi:hypothetical protein